MFDKHTCAIDTMICPEPTLLAKPPALFVSKHLMSEARAMEQYLIVVDSAQGYVRAKTLYRLNGPGRVRTVQTAHSRLYLGLPSRHYHKLVALPVAFYIWPRCITTYPVLDSSSTRDKRRDEPAASTHILISLPGG